MWWRGWRHTAEEAYDREHRTHPARRAADARPRAERPRGHAARDSTGRLRALAGPALVVAAVDRTRAAGRLPREPDAPRDLPKSLLAAVGRRDREHPVLGTPDLGRPVPGLRDQLHPSRLPRALVPGLGAVHVPVSRRRLLCRRPARVGTPAAPALPVRSQDRERAALGARWTDSHAVGIGVMGFLRTIGEWLDQRLGLGEPLAEVATHRVPRDTASWWYVFGSATLVCFVVQVVTGICLATVYVPSADGAWQSLEVLNYEQPLGWYLRAVHGWGSNFMVALMSVHLIQVFLFGAYKYPRELTWTAGVILFLCTLGMAFTGQVLRFDQDAYWGLGIGVAIAGRAPFIGREVVHLILGGPIIAAETLSRFFTLHVFVIPGLLIAFVGLHLFLVLKLGINEWPMPGRLVSRETYRRNYEALVERDGVPFFPDAAKRDLVAAGVTIAAIMACAALFGPFGPNGAPDPTIIQTTPRPDFYFLSLFSAFPLLPPYTETVLILTAPVLGIIVLFLVPFLTGTGEKSWQRRPVAVLSVILIVL